MENDEEGSAQYIERKAPRTGQQAGYITPLSWIASRSADVTYETICNRYLQNCNSNSKHCINRKKVFDDDSCYSSAV